MNEHILTNVNYETKTATCAVCGEVRIKIKKIKGYRSRQCWNVWRAQVKRYRDRSKPYRENKAKLRKAAYLAAKESGLSINAPKYRKFVKMVCERCGFKAVHPCQMDGHHKDNNHENNVAENIESLCPSCHRLEHLPQNEKEKIERGVYTKTPTEASNGLESKGMESYEGGKVAVERSRERAAEFIKKHDGLFKSLAVVDGATEVTLLKREVDVLKNQLSQMTKSYEFEFNRAENLVIDLGNAKDELEQVAGWTEDEKTRYWRGRALQAELTLKGKTNEFDQG